MYFINQVLKETQAKRKGCSRRPSEASRSRMKGGVPTTRGGGNGAGEHRHNPTTEQTREGRAGKPQKEPREEKCRASEAPN